MKTKITEQGEGKGSVGWKLLWVKQDVYLISMSFDSIDDCFDCDFGNVVVLGSVCNVNLVREGEKGGVSIILCLCPLRLLLMLFIYLSTSV